MIQNFLDDQWILDARDDLDCSATTIAGRDIDTKHALKPLRPRHFLMLAHWRLCVLLALQVLLAIASLATFRRCHIDSMLAVWR